jgi:hypothetical protein
VLDRLICLGSTAGTASLASQLAAPSATCGLLHPAVMCRCGLCSTPLAARAGWRRAGCDVSGSARARRASAVARARSVWLAARSGPYACMQQQHCTLGRGAWLPPRRAPKQHTAGQQPAEGIICLPCLCRPADTPLRVLITGGSSGVGKALAREFLKCGDSVLVTSRSAAGSQAAAEQLREEAGGGGRVMGKGLGYTGWLFKVRVAKQLRCASVAQHTRRITSACCVVAAVLQAWNVMSATQIRWKA